MYRFDRQLRVAMFNQIEKIEVAVRSAIANIMTKETGNPFWMTNPEYYTSLTTYRGSIQKVDVEYNKSREDFIKHFKSTYEDPYPPSWMLVEIISLGTLTRIYQSIKSNKIRKKIAQEFDLQIPVFESWMTIITVARNNCGHHARVWNRTFALRALTMRKNKRPWITQDVNMKKVYFSLCVIKYFINVIVPNNDMTAKLTALFADYPEIDITAMGFPKNWQQEPLWL
jgi:abortive infection bacteriophage resistance protein